MLFFGAFVFIFFSKKKNDASLFYAVTLIGGFVFHTFWEAKCQYTLPYVMLLIPLSVDGYRVLMKGILLTGSVSMRQWRMCGIFAAAFVFVACMIGMSHYKLFEYIFLRQEDTEAYAQYVSDRTYMRLRNGNYFITASIGGTDYTLAEGSEDESDGNAAHLRLSELRDTAYIAQSELNNDFYIRFDGNGRCLDVPDGQAEEGKILHSYTQNGSGAQRWDAHRSSAKGKVNIIFGTSWALTIDEESHSVYLSQFTDSPNQQWELEKYK